MKIGDSASNLKAISMNQDGKCNDTVTSSGNKALGAILPNPCASECAPTRELNLIGIDRTGNAPMALSRQSKFRLSIGVRDVARTPYWRRISGPIIPRPNPPMGREE